MKEIFNKNNTNLFKKNNKKILGIDLGLARIGFGILEETQYFVKYISRGCILTSGHNTVSYRIHFIYLQLIKIIEIYQIEQVILEKVFHNINTKTINVINQIHGMILLLLEQNNIIYKEYTPIQVKQSILLNKNSNKKDVIKRLETIFDLKNTGGSKLDDAFDGIACAYTYLYSKNKLWFVN